MAAFGSPPPTADPPAKGCSIPKRAADVAAHALDQRPKKRVRVVEPEQEVPTTSTSTQTEATASASNAPTVHTRASSRKARVEDWPEEASAPLAADESQEHQEEHEREPGADEQPTTGKRLLRPSVSLRRKCPLCFGGERAQLQHTE